MRWTTSLYIPGNSAIHRCDTRVKIALLLAYSVTLFFVRTWPGLLLCTAACLTCCAVARMSVRRLLSFMIPLYALLALTLAFNSFSFDVSSTTRYYGIGNVSAGVFAEMDNVPLVGSFGFIPSGFAHGCYFVLRIVLLVLSSLVVSLTSTSTALTSAFNGFLRPLQKLRVPTADIAMIVAIALRFIPLTADEFMRVYAAQWSRGAPFDKGSLFQRLKAWQTTFVPLFVGLFRRADHLACAMESRCYGMRPTRTELDKPVMAGADWGALLFGAGLFVFLAVFL